MVEVDELVEGLVEEIVDRVSDSEVHVVNILVLGAELISREVGLWNVSWCSEFVQLLVSSPVDNSPCSDHRFICVTDRMNWLERYSLAREQRISIP